MTNAIRKELAEGSKNSNFVRNVFVNEYPRLVAIFEALCGRIIKHVNAASSAPFLTSSVAVQTIVPASYASFTSACRSELVAALSSFHTAFLTRAVKLLNEPVKLMFSTQHTVPSRSDVSALISVIDEHLTLIKDAHEDVQLSVCTLIQEAVCLFVEHSEKMAKKDPDRNIFPTGAGATPNHVQRTNSELYNIGHHLSKTLFWPTFGGYSLLRTHKHTLAAAR